MLKFERINKSFSGVEVLHDISFDIDEGKVTALVGENGAGKSTLMKILSGVHSDYEGSIYLDDEKVYFRNPREAELKGISIIHQELNVIPDLSVGENIFLGRESSNKIGFVNFKELYKEADIILKEFEFPYSTKIKVSSLSVGWQQIVEIARALSIDSKIIVMDEPTSALSESEIKILFDKINLLREKGKTIIFISHRLEEIFKIADDIAVLRDGKFIRKYPAGGIKRDDLINKMVGKKFYESLKSENKKREEIILSVKDLSVFDKKKTHLSRINFDLNKGEILGLAGLMGSGKTELLKFLFGEFKEEFNGEINFNNQIYKPFSASKSLMKSIFYLSKNRKEEGIFPGLNLVKNSTISVLSEFSLSGFIKERKEFHSVEKETKSLNVKMKSLLQPIKTLSGGNQQKVLIGRGLMLQPELMLLDEPTRGIDVGAKEEIYNLIEDLSKNGMSFILSSSEIPELLRVCDRILVLSAGVQTALLKTNETNTEEILHYAFSRV